MYVILVTYLITSGMLALLLFFAWASVRILLRLTNKPHRIRYRMFGYTTLVLVAVWGILLVYGYRWGRWRHEVTYVTFSHPQIPERFDGYRIVHISDLHLEGFGDNPAYLDTLLCAVNNLHPDLICFTGDLVSLSHRGAATFKDKLARMKAKDGIISVLGNHDYGVYDHLLDTKGREEDLRKLVGIQRDELGWTILMNENKTLYHEGDSIAILGSENQNCGPHQKVRRGDLDKAMAGTDGMFRLLLTHDPTHWDTEVVGKKDIPLTLSGHTHAMQFMFLGLTPCRLFFPHTHGEYTIGKQTLYVNIGMGQLMPFRIGATPEITLITLRKSTE